MILAGGEIFVGRDQEIGALGVGAWRTLVWAAAEWLQWRGQLASARRRWSPI